MHIELKLPPAELRFMNEADDKFVAIGDLNMDQLVHAGLNEKSRLLDIGSGYGRLAYALHSRFPSFCGRYLGVDILARHVEWCQQNISPALDGYEFEVINVQNDRYLATGMASATSFRFDYPDASFDQVGLFSVFTHMYEEEIDNYLSEISRLLDSGGTCVATFFTFDDARLEMINSRGTGITLNHELGADTRYFNPDDPLHAIAFRQTHVEAMVARHGMKVDSVTLGHWAGGNSAQYQDVFVIAR